MSAQFYLYALLLLALVAPGVGAQPGRTGFPPAPLVPPAPLYLPPPVQTQGLGSLSSPVVPRPIGSHVAPYGGLGYGPLGDRTGYPGSVFNTYRGSYLAPSTLPPLVLETPSGLPLRSGTLPALDVLFPGPLAAPNPLRMPAPIPPGPVVPVGESK